MRITYRIGRACTGVWGIVDNIGLAIGHAPDLGCGLWKPADGYNHDRLVQKKTHVADQAGFDIDLANPGYKLYSRRVDCGDDDICIQTNETDGDVRMFSSCESCAVQRANREVCLP